MNVANAPSLTTDVGEDLHEDNQYNVALHSPGLLFNVEHNCGL